MRTVILKDAYDTLVKRIEQIKKDIRLNSKEIGRAAELGDLSENAEYDAAKEKQSELFSTLNNLETYLKARLIEEKDINTEVVSFGTRVKLFDMNKHKIVSYVVAGPVEFELEIYPSIVTFTSPLGQGLIGKKKGQVVDIELPSQTSRFLILNIEPVTEESSIHPDLLIMGHAGYGVTDSGDIEKENLPGGPAYYTGVAASALSDRTAIITSIKKDHDELNKAFNKLSVFADGIKLSDSIDSLSAADIPSEYYKAKYLHISEAPPDKQLQWLKDVKNGGSFKGHVSIEIREDFSNDHRDILAEILQDCGFIFTGKNGFKFMEEMDDVEIEDKVIVVIKSDGSTELWIDGELQLDEKGFDGETVDFTGYKGVLAGAFLAALSMGQVEETAYDVAVRIASKSLEDHGIDNLLEVKED
jgi:transcription elongation factor GreA